MTKNSDDQFARFGDLGRGRRPAEREAQRSPRLVLRIAHRTEDVADFVRSAHAGRPCRARQPRQIERDRHSASVQTGHHKRGDARQPLARMAGLLESVHGGDRRHK